MHSNQENIRTDLKGSKDSNRKRKHDKISKYNNMRIHLQIIHNYQ